MYFALAIGVDVQGFVPSRVSSGNRRFFARPELETDAK